MKKILVVLWFLLAGIVFAQDKKADPPKKEESVKADTDFVKQYDELMALGRVIQQIETENNLPKMRERSNAMVSRLRSWMIAHKVDGWTYDEQTQSFVDKRPKVAKENEKK